MGPRLPSALLVLGALAAGCATPPAPPPAPAAVPQAPPETAVVPPGAQAAVAAFHGAFPGAVLDEVVRPKGFGSGSGDEPPLFWTMRYHAGDARDEALVSPAGLLVRRKQSIDAASLPPAVAAALAQASAGASPGALTRHETLARLAYVAAAAPELSWVATVEKDGRAARFSVKPDGTVQRGGGGEEEDEGDEEKDEKEGAGQAAPAPKEIPIPDEAARAVAAVKQVWPDAVVQAVESVPIDDGTGHFDVLQFEVEFVFGGAMKQVLASPDGIVLRIDRPADRGSLPTAVAAAIERESAAGRVRSIVAIEGRADLRFVALAEPRVVYEAVLTRDGKESSVRFTPEGNRIEPLRLGAR
jgi:hypothetical protein